MREINKKKSRKKKKEKTFSTSGELLTFNNLVPFPT